MAALTRTLLIAAIKRESRIGDGTELDTLVGDILDDVVADVFYKERCFELRVVAAGVAMTASTPTINLPADFQNVDEVNFSKDNGDTMEKLLPKDDFVNLKITGIPQWWQLVGTTLYVFPYSLAAVAHKIFLTYFKTPTFSAAGDLFPVFRLQATVKKEAITRILDYLNDQARAQRMEASASGSLARGMAANPTARDFDPLDTRQPSEDEK